MSTALPSVEDMEKATALLMDAIDAIDKAAKGLPNSFLSSHTYNELLDAIYTLKNRREGILFNIKKHAESHYVPSSHLPARARPHLPAPERER